MRFIVNPILLTFIVMATTCNLARALCVMPSDLADVRLHIVCVSAPEHCPPGTHAAGGSVLCRQAGYPASYIFVGYGSKIIGYLSSCDYLQICIDK